ncbi:PAS domain S-box protein [Paraburkholderia aspalathi]|nr:PAS domain S-box protein [Paraburkholderia aspalathi]
MEELIRALRHEIDNVRRRKDSLNAGYKETFDNAGVGIAHVSLDGEFLDINKCFCEMLGRTKEELATMRFKDVSYPEELGTNIALLGRLKRGEIPGYRMEKRYIHANGSVFWGDLSVAPQRDENGAPIKLISVVVDITQKKQDQERVEFMMGELAHRTKNMAAIMQSIINQSAANAGSIADFRAIVTARLASIVASQNSITEKNDQKSSLQELIKRQLAIFLTPNDPRIHVSGTDIYIGSDASRAIGMTLHELCTNSIKYGSLSSQAGSLEIDWNIEPSPDGKLYMSWVERNGPEVQKPLRSGFGRKVIERMVALTTNGKVELKFEPNGVEWHLEANIADLK